MNLQRGPEDELFIRVLYVLVTLVVLWGIGIAAVLVLSEPSEVTVTRFINSFGAIFAGLLGLCTGYLLGRKNGR